MPKTKIKPKSKKPSSQWEIVEDFKLIPMAQDGKKLTYQWSNQQPPSNYTLATPKDVNVSRTESNRKLTQKEIDQLAKYTAEQNQLKKEQEYNQRKQAIQQSIEAQKQPLTINNLRTQTQATGDKMSLAMNSRFGNPKEYPILSGYMDALDFINPGKFIGDMGSGIGAIPYNLREGNYGQAAFAVAAPLVTGAIGSFGQKPAGSLFREQVYKGIDPVAYGMKEKLKSAPKTWLKNTLAKDEQQRALEIGKQLSNLNPEYFANDITRIGQNRLDAFRVGLKLPQRYNTFEKIGENTYRIKDMNPQVGEFSSVYNDLQANDFLSSNTVYSGENPLVYLSKKHDKLTSPVIKTDFGDYSVNDLRRYLLKKGDDLPPWEQHRIVEKAKNPEFNHSVYDADRQGIMGSFRWDIKKPSFENDYKLHFQSNDLWNLNPFEKRGQITVKGNEELLKNWYKPLENFEALSFVGGKPFNIQNNFVVDSKTYKILEKYKSGGKIKTEQIINENMKKKLKLKKSNSKKMQQGGITDWFMTNGGYLPMAQDGDLVLPPSMLQPVDPTQIPLRAGVAEQVPFTIRGEYSAKEVKEKAAPKYVGLVDYLASKGMAIDKESRKALAKKLGIKDYDFSAAKNTELLKLLKSNDKINAKVAEHQQYTFPESLSSDVMSAPPAVIRQSVSTGRFPDQYKQVDSFPGDEYSPYNQNVTQQTTAKPSQKAKSSGEYSDMPDWDLYKENSRTFRYFFNPDFRINVDKTTKLDKELQRRGYKDWEDIRKAEEKKGRFKSPYSSSDSYPKIKYAPSHQETHELPPIQMGQAPGFQRMFATGGCMSCGGKMQDGGKYLNNPIDLYEYDRTMDLLRTNPDQYDMEQYALNQLMRENHKDEDLYWKDKDIMYSALKNYGNEKGAMNKANKLSKYEPQETPEFASGGWIQKATASIKRRGTEGKCTPITNPGCTGRAKALAKTFKKIAKERKKEYGGYAVGSEYEMDDAQIAKLRAMGYKIKVV